MPKLQIDGVDIAEIGSELADQALEHMRQYGVGRGRQPHQFQTAIQYHMRSHIPVIHPLVLDLEFGEIGVDEGAA